MAMGTANVTWDSKAFDVQVRHNIRSETDLPRGLTGCNLGPQGASNQDVYF